MFLFLHTTDLHMQFTLHWLIQKTLSAARKKNQTNRVKKTINGKNKKNKEQKIN